MNKKQTKYIKECCEEMYGYLWKYKKDYVDDLAQNASSRLKEKLESSKS